MKKTLQTNIAGFLFTIEEDAFQDLNNYLNALKKYFSTYESCDEIVQDIESRIAEKFFQKTEGSKIITLDDVKNIIASMGTVSDFEALKEDEDLYVSKPQATSASSNQFIKGLYKDGKQKALGGVLAGLAHKYNFDVVWARILFLVFAGGLITEGVGPVLLILYLVAWIVLPLRYDLEYNPKIKKFFRNPEDKVIGGVASGLAIFLKTDIKIIRILFVVTGCLGGIGIIIYLLFWIVVPMAHTVTQKLQLEGQPVTIQNIEKSVKIKENPQVAPRESTLSKILLFPFRVIGAIFTFLGRLIRPIAGIFKVFIGFIITITGVSVAFSALVILGAFFGYQNSPDWIQTGNWEINQLMAEIPVTGSFFAFFTLFIPGVVLTIAGLMLIINRVIGNKNLWAVLLLIWLTGVVGFTAIATKLSLNFSKAESINTEEVYAVNTSELLIIDAPINDNFNNESTPRFTINSNDTDKVATLLKKKSNGPNSREAQRNASNITYKINAKGNTLFFDNNFEVKEGEPFRNQRVQVYIKLPKGTKFKLTSNFLSSFGYPDNIPWKLKSDYSGQNTFIINQEGAIECLDCPDQSPYENIEDNFNYNSFSRDFDRYNNTNFNLKLHSKDAFNALNVSGNFNIILVKADSFSVHSYSDNEEILKEVKSKIDRNTLDIAFNDPFKSYDETTFIYITSPKMQRIDISKGASLKMYGFDNAEVLNVSVRDKSKAAIDTKGGSINLTIDQKSNVLLQGELTSLIANISNKSILKAQKTQISHAKIKASSSSAAEFSKLNNKSLIADKDSIIKEEE